MAKLIPITKEKFKLWLSRQTEAYIQDKMKANGYTRTEAEEICHKQMKELLPNGMESKDQHIFEIDDGMQTLGFLWFAVIGAENNRRAFVYDIVIEKEFQGKGFGKTAMKLLEAEVLKLGLNRIGLHVFGHNHIARNLYDSLGYEIQDLVLEKKISGGIHDLNALSKAR